MHTPAEPCRSPHTKLLNLHLKVPGPLLRPMRSPAAAITLDEANKCLSVILAVTALAAALLRAFDEVMHRPFSLSKTCAEPVLGYEFQFKIIKK